MQKKIAVKTLHIDAQNQNCKESSQQLLWTKKSRLIQMKKQKVTFKVLVFPRSRRAARLMDIPRRASDQLGLYGICAKRGQDNDTVRMQGHLSLRFPSRRLARQYQASLLQWSTFFSTQRRICVKRKRK